MKSFNRQSYQYPNPHLLGILQLAGSMERIVSHLESIEKFPQPTSGSLDGEIIIATISRI